MVTTPKIKRKIRLPIEVLDRTRPFGEVFGEGTLIKYTQNAKKLEAWPYDAHDNLIEAALNLKQVELLKGMRAAAEERAKTETDKAPIEEDEDVDSDAVPSDDDEPEPDAPSAPDNDDINLVMWLKGELKVRAPDIQKVLKARFGVNKPSTQQQALYLVEEQKLLPRDQVHRSILPPPQP